MNRLYSGDTFELSGHSFVVKFETDYFYGFPWEHDDGRGIVRKSSSRHSQGYSDKSPSERPLNDAGRNEYQFYYDWKASLAKAKADGWDCAPYGKPDGYIRAVQEDFNFIRAYLANDWEYVFVTVSMLDEDGNETGESESLGGVESWADYHCEVAYELAKELADSASRDWHENMATFAARAIAVDAAYAGV